ncbi:MAG: hypothetical protein ABSA11_04055 [Candidatus Bathyarchaeia archaeon]
MVTVLFICVHNAGRSQMSEAFFNKLPGRRRTEESALGAGALAYE